jgi:hypothetical protein
VKTPVTRIQLSRLHRPIDYRDGEVPAKDVAGHDQRKMSG